MKIAITGALGHIGSLLIKTLPDTVGKCEIVIVDNLLTQRYPSLFDLPDDISYQFHELDVTRADLRPILQDVEVVIHLAAITDAASSFDNSEAVEINNFEGTQAVAEACIDTGTRMIHLSSTSVYGTQAETVDESCSATELSPQSPYAECKLKEEALLRDMAEQHVFNYIVLRFGTICGVSPGSSPTAHRDQSSSSRPDRRPWPGRGRRMRDTLRSHRCG